MLVCGHELPVHCKINTNSILRSQETRRLVLLRSRSCRIDLVVGLALVRSFSFFFFFLPRSNEQIAELEPNCNQLKKYHCSLEFLFCTGFSPSEHRIASNNQHRTQVIRDHPIVPRVLSCQSFTLFYHFQDAATCSRWLRQ